MNKTEFIQLVQDPDLPATRHVGALKQVVADFPYFTVSQILLAKALHNEKHYEYEKHLKQTALTVPDREVLYYYLHNLAAPQMPQPVTEMRVPEPVIIPAAVPVAEEPIPAEPVLVEEPEVLVAEVPVEPEIIPEPQPAVIENVAAPALPEVEATVPLIPEEVPAPIPDVIALPEQPAEENAELVAIQPGEQHTTDEEHSFLEWLSLKSGKTVVLETVEPPAPIAETKPIPAEPVIPVPVPTEPEPVKLQEITRADIEEAVAKSNVNDFGSILDRFIKENPSISRPKAEFFNPVNMARQSVEEDDELVTETLASLLYKQGNLKKAIRAYEKLCLLYPSKMTYFASLIQKIKTELKD